MDRPPYSIFLGDVALDEYYRAERWPGIREKLLVDALPAVPGGMIANAACVAAALGMQVKFLAILNSGPISRFLLDDLEKSGVDTSMVVFDDSLPDSKTMIYLVDGEHTIFIPRMGIQKFEITPQQLEALAGAEFLYTTPTEIASLRCGAMDSNAIIDHCRARGVKLVYDLDVDYIRDGDETRFQRLDIAFFNETGFDSYRGLLSYDDAIRRLQSYGVEIIVVTLAEKGCIAYTQDGTYFAQARQVPVVDVTGAGDTFCASFLYSLSSGGGVILAVQFANVAASLCVSGMGARAGAVPAAVIEEILGL